MHPPLDSLAMMGFGWIPLWKMLVFVSWWWSITCWVASNHQWKIRFTPLLMMAWEPKTLSIILSVNQWLIARVGLPNPHRKHERTWYPNRLTIHRQYWLYVLRISMLGPNTVRIWSMFDGKHSSFPSTVPPFHALLGHWVVLYLHFDPAEHRHNGWKCPSRWHVHTELFYSSVEGFRLWVCESKVWGRSRLLCQKRTEGVLKF